MKSLLLELLLVFERHTALNASWTFTFTLVAAFAPTVTTFTLLRRRDLAENTLLLIAPFTLIGATGIVLPMITSGFLNDKLVLERSAAGLEQIGALHYLSLDRLYVEAIMLVIIFLVAALLYSRMLIYRLERKRGIFGIVFDCGQEFVLSLGILFVSAAVFSGKYILMELPEFWVRLFFYGVVLVAYKSAICLFLLVYVSIFGARENNMRKLGTAPVDGDNTLQELAERPGGFRETDSAAIFSIVRRKSLVNFAFCMFPALVFGLCIDMSFSELSGSRYDPESIVAFGIFAILFVFMLYQSMKFLLWAVIPRMHPLSRHLKAVGGDDFEYAARKFLREYNAPVYKWSSETGSNISRRFVITENYLVNESRFAMRVYNLKDIAKMDISPLGSHRICFANGKHCNIGNASVVFLHLLSQYTK